jgi:DNA-directed RNA polymerase subunit RPC12/RpoP
MNHKPSLVFVSKYLQAFSGFSELGQRRIIDISMAYPVKTCVTCHEEFELKPDKPGFANRCPDCTETEATESQSGCPTDADERRTNREANEARREAMRNLLYRKDS